MSRRIEIELTSHTDGAWTWRAAGARQPRGALDGASCPGTPRSGDVLRAEVESGIEGIEVVEVLAPKTKDSDEKKVERIEVIGAPRRGPDVSVILAPGSRRRRDDGDRRPRRDGGPRPRRRPAAATVGGGERSGGRRAQPASGRRPGSRATARGRPPDVTSARRDDGRPSGRRGEGRGPDRGPDRGAGRRDRRPTVSTTHRNAMLAELRPEQLPVAEQLLRGGIPAVRQAIAEQNEAARASGAPAGQLRRPAEDGRGAAAGGQAGRVEGPGRPRRRRQARNCACASCGRWSPPRARSPSTKRAGRVAKTLRESLDQRVNALREEWVNRLDRRPRRAPGARRPAHRHPHPRARHPAARPSWPSGWPRRPVRP